MRTWRELTFIVVTLAAAAPFPVHAQYSVDALRATLGGLDSVRVSIDLNDNESRAAGISEPALRTKTELALRQAQSHSGSW